MSLCRQWSTGASWVCRGLRLFILNLQALKFVEQNFIECGVGLRFMFLNILA